MRSSGGVLGLALAASLAPGCAHVQPARAVGESVASNPATVWSPPPEGRPPAPTPTPPPAILEKYLKGEASPSLPEIVDLALRNNPSTRVAWFQARAAAAELGSKRAAYFPEIDLNANITRQKTAAVGGLFTYLQTTYGPSASLNYLLFNFGGREADADEARQALFAANWTHDAAIQNLVLQVEQAYYQYLNAKALAASAEASLKQAEESLAAAEERHRAGVATIADVLQAKTARSQAQLALTAARGLIQTYRGELATAVGVSPEIPVDVGELPEIVSLEGVSQSVDGLIEKARSERPDLAAAWFEASKAESHVRSVRAEGLPSLSAAGTVGRTYYYNSTGAPYSNNYSGAILFRFPLFTGFRSRYDTLKAQEEASAARAQADTLSNLVIFQVWSSYYGVQTATQQVRTARDLLASAEQSQEVALARYKAGVGSILDLLTAQSALAAARAEEVLARAGWFLALTQLAHDTGALTPPAGAPAPPSVSKGQRDNE